MAVKYHVLARRDQIWKCGKFSYPGWKTGRQANQANACRKYCCSPLTPGDHYGTILPHGSYISRMDTAALLGRHGWWWWPKGGAYWSAGEPGLLDKIPYTTADRFLVWSYLLTYLCEKAFSTMLQIKTTAGNRLQMGLLHDMRVALTNTRPRFEKLVAHKQQQKSHWFMYHWLPNCAYLTFSIQFF